MNSEAVGPRNLPPWRWLLLLLGTVILLSVYYLDYSGDFHEGSSASNSPLALPMRALAVMLIAASLAPFRARPGLPFMLIVAYLLAGFSYATALGTYGELNDRLFLNTLLQLPVLWAFSQACWRIDYARWLRFIGGCLLIEAGIDLLVLIFGNTLWLSEAFVGGFGNPSTFGLICSVLVAFYLFHPRAGKRALLKASALAIAAVMTKSLFAVLAVVALFGFWTLQTRRRMAGGALVGAALLCGVVWWVNTHEEEVFLLHKLSAAGAFVGLMDYDTDTSKTVSLRSEMHERTFSAIASDPARLLSGHLEHNVYWQMDSQFLTYLGSFGLLFVTLFFALHFIWMLCAARSRSADARFALGALCLFGVIFFTNRILDYFPAATIYFVCVAMATDGGRGLPSLAIPVAQKRMA